MAQNRSPAFFAVALLILAAAAPLGLAQVPLAQLLTPVQLPLLDAITVTDTLCCTPTLNCPGGPELAGVNYTMSCAIGGLVSSSASLVVAQGVTGPNGQINITLDNAPSLVSSLGTTVSDVLAGNLPCEVTIDLPTDEALCSTLTAVNGAISARLTALGATIPSSSDFVMGFGLNLC